MSGPTEADDRRTRVRLPEWLARVNRVVTNPVQRLWAGRLPPLAVVEHRGRRTGRRHRTPVLAFPTPSGFAVVLFYGPDRDWLANLRASGGGVLMRRGRRLEVGEPALLRGASAEGLLPRPMVTVLRVLGHPPVLHLTVHGRR